MAELILVFCLATAPANCQEEKPALADMSLMSCLVQGQQYAADWLAGEENQISIRPRTMRASRFRLTVDQFAVVFALSVLMLPELLLIVGIVVWWERRN